MDPAEQASIEPQKRESRLLRGIMIGAVFILLAAVVMASIAESDNPVLKQAFTSGRPTILVKPFTTNEETRVSNEVLSGLTNEIVVDLAKFRELVVITEGAKTNADTTYTRQGSIRLEADDMRAIARLVRRPDGAVVWSSGYDVNIKGRSILDAQMAIARLIAAAVAAPFGAGAEGPVMPKVGTGSVRVGPLFRRRMSFSEAWASFWVPTTRANFNPPSLLLV